MGNLSLLKIDEGRLLRKSFGLIVIVFALLIFSSFSLSSMAATGAETITVAFTNDLHGFLLPFEKNGTSKGGVGRIASLLNDIREKNKNVLYLDAGDVITGSGTKYKKEEWEEYLPHKLYRGLLTLELLNEVGVDAMVLGNHEFDYGLKWLEKLLAIPKFNILSANAKYDTKPDVEEKKGDLIAQPFEYFKHGDITLGVVGLTTDQYIQSSQISIEDPVRVLEEMLPSIQREADYVIVLSHLGIGKDKELAKEFDEIDLIIGAHSHRTLFSPIKIGGTRIVSSGSYGRYLGTLDLSFENRKVADIEYKLLPVTEKIRPHEEIDKLVQRKLTVGKLAQDLEWSNNQQSSLGELITKSMLWYSGADVALISSGTYKGKLGEGVVEVSEFFDVFWPESTRGGAEKDLNEKQLINLMKKFKGQRPFVAVVGASDGLETLTCLELKAKELQTILEENEEKKDQYSYLQIGVDSSLKDGNDERINISEGESYKVVLNLGLALGRRLRKGEFEQLWKPEDLVFSDLEIFEVVLKYLNNQR